MTYAFFVSWLIVRRTKGHKFSRNDPINIAVLNFFVVLILSDVKFSIVEPIESDRILQPSEAIQNLHENDKYCAFITTLPVSSISIGPKPDLLEGLISLLRCFVEHDHLNKKIITR